jgi:hypothetical protein
LVAIARNSCGSTTLETLQRAQFTHSKGDQYRWDNGRGRQPACWGCQESSGTRNTHLRSALLTACSWSGAAGAGEDLAGSLGLSSRLSTSNCSAAGIIAACHHRCCSAAAPGAHSSGQPQPGCL